MRHVTVVLAALALMAASASADWSENFDSYTVGSSMHGQGGWEGWEGNAGATAYVTDEYSQSPNNSVDIVGPSDLVHQYQGYTSGEWEYSAYMYVPGDFQSGGTGTSRGSYFILLNTYGAGIHNWSVQCHADSDTQTFIRDGLVPAYLPLIKDQWVEIRTVINLDQDWYKVYYGGQELGVAESWTMGVYGQGGGQLNVGAVDLFANESTSVYWDDLSLVPEPASCLLLVVGLGLLRRR